MANKTYKVTISLPIEVECRSDDFPSITHISEELIRLFHDTDDDGFASDLVRHSFCELMKKVLHGAVVSEYIRTNGWVVRPNADGTKSAVAYRVADYWDRQAEIKHGWDAYNLSVEEAK